MSQPTLSPEHVRQLQDDSGIDPDVIKARGYETVTEAKRLAALGFTKPQRRVPGILVPTYSPDGAVVAHQFKPDKPRKDKKKNRPVKYETPKGGRVWVNVPPGAAAALPETAVPLWITEGAKKADAAVTAGLCCVSLQGVDCWRSGDGPLPEWEAVALDGRQVFVAFDSDAMTKDEVKTALDSLTSFLLGRGALVAWVLLPETKDAIDGSTAKVGLDDWLVAHDMTASGLMKFVVRPEANIKINDVALKDLTRATIASLRQTNVPERLFARDGLMVEARAEGVKAVDSSRLLYLMSEGANWYRTVQRGEKVVRRPCSPPKDVVSTVAAAGSEVWGFPRLDRIVTTPVFAADGSLRTEPGYHPASRSYYMPPEGLTIRRVSKKPTKAEVKEAKALINEMFRDFAFVDESDKAAAWAMLLQPFARELIRGGASTPLYSVQAPKQGTGKTILVQSALSPAVGNVDSQAEPHGDEEMEKRLTSMMREAQPVVFFDNVDRFISYPSLASALTKPTWSGRVLGSSSTVTSPVSCLFALTANNPRFSDDMKRRVVPVRLDAKTEDPSQRTGFAHSLPSWAVNNRADLIWAACTVIASWVAAGRPNKADDTPVLASYAAWRRVMGGILHNAGIVGFLGNLASTRAEKSPDQETLEAICEFAVKGFGEGRPWRVGELSEYLFHEDVELTFSKPYRSAEELGSLLTYFLRGRRNQIVSGHRLDRAASRQGRGYQWRFKKVEEA